MENKKITWKTIIQFLIGLCILTAVISIPYYSLQKNGYMYNDVRHKTNTVAKEKSDTLDVVFLGDSEAWAAYSPLQLYHEYGFTSYNCATPGQWTMDSARILRKVLKNQSPSVVVLGTSTIFNYPNPLRYALAKYLPIFHYHYFYKNTDISYKDANTKGANLTDTAIAYTGTLNYMKSNTTPLAMDANSLKGLNCILEICQKNHIQLVLSTSPSALTWNEGKHQTIANWCKENDVTYIDYNEGGILYNIDFDWSTDTRDGGDHVNLSGSKKVTKNFGRRLVRMYSLPDHRDSEAYETWEKAYEAVGLYN